MDGGVAIAATNERHQERSAAASCGGRFRRSSSRRERRRYKYYQHPPCACPATFILIHRAERLRRPVGPAPLSSVAQLLDILRDVTYSMRFMKRATLAPRQRGVE